MPFPPEIGSFEVQFRGFDVVRGRDCILFSKGDSFVVRVSEEMIAGGWSGGTGATWVDSPHSEPVVSYSSGLFGGFMLYGSDESADQFKSDTRRQLVHPQSAVMVAGSAVLSTSSYEHYSYASRLSGGALVPLVYRSGEPLFFSRRGMWTLEDEASLGAPLPFAPAQSAGVVVNPPAVSNQRFLTIQTTL